MQNNRYIQCDDSCNIKIYSDAIFINELNNCKLLYFLSYIILDTKIGSLFGGKCHRCESNSLLSAICKIYPLTILHTILIAPAKLTKLQKYYSIMTI